MQPLKTEAIKRFLNTHTYPDLAALYSYEREVQVNVAQDGGQRVEDDYKGRKWHGWTDGIQTWKPIRIPWNASTDPTYTDSPINFDLVEHAEGIGLTGWDWVNKQSLWFGFDFDKITSHVRGLTEVQLGEVQTAAADLPWTTIRRSTSGNGLHIYIFITPTHTKTHTEHSALARSILSMMSAVTGFDFQSKVDSCGSILWVYHRKMKGTNGLQLLKKGEILTDIPISWRDHIPVINGRRKKVLPQFIAEIENESTQDENERIFEEITGQRPKITLDDQHKKLIEWLRSNNAVWWFDNDHYILVTHTIYLKEAHEELGLKGIFKTVSTGKDRGSDINCFCFAMRGGGWVVRRFSPGVTEENTWEQDSNGYTKCYYNKAPDLAIASRANEGVEHPTGGYIFRHAEQAQQTALLLNANLGLPTWAAGKKAKLKEHKDGRLIAEIERSANDEPAQMKGWLEDGKNWKKIFNINTNTPNEIEISGDDFVRHLTTETGSDYGWMLKGDEGKWHQEPFINVKTAILGKGYSPKETNAILGGGITRAWTVVNKAFQPEYPGGREWNMNAPQFRFHPTEDHENLHYPHWTMILNHIGIGLDHAIKSNNWAINSRIISGADYLKCWIASLFQHPDQPLPYLFLWGEQNNGKSIFHEALHLLVTSGIDRGDNALKSQSNFNGELENLFLCVIEETNLNKDKNAYNKIKDWVTARTVQIHAKHSKPFSIPNTLHFVQCHPADTWILTSEGPRQIFDLLNKPVDIIYNGEVFKTEGFFQTGYKELFEIETIEGFKVRATENHKFLVDFDGFAYDLPLNKITIGDKLYLCNHPNVEWEGEGTFEDGYILGLLFGDGSINPISRQEHLGFDYPDHCHVQDVIEMFPKYPNVNEYNDQIRISSPYLKELVKKYGLDKFKYVNPHIEAESSEFLKGFISGFCVSDAGLTAPELRLGQSNLPRLEGVQRILSYLGIIGEIRACNDQGEYELIIRKSNLVRFRDRIGLRHPVKHNLLEKWYRKHKAQPRSQEDFTVRIKNIKSVGYHNTFDITVPKVNHFSANGFVSHNCDNDSTSCPVFAGDTKITMIEVKPLEPGTLIPKRELEKFLEKEAPDFLASVLTLEIPESNDRLNVPVIITEEKLQLERANQTYLETFIKENCYEVTGKYIMFSDFCDRFWEWVGKGTAEEYSKIRISKELPLKYPADRLPKTGYKAIGNLSWEARSPSEDILPRLVVRHGKLVSEE